MTTDTHTQKTRWLRPVAVFAGALMTLGVLTACGSDDSGTTPEDAFCEAGDSLKTDVGSLADLDLVADGTNGLEDQLTAIKSDIDDLRSSGQEVAAPEIDALDSALDELKSTAETLGDSPSVQAVADAATSVTGVVTSAQAVFDTLDSTCS
ncbi:MAG TPA: hypothetical protein VMW08_05020 [Acidimicrobiales bacterium]|nr:hypothetical protein [Acidimicrobiales bacterium]